MPASMALLCTENSVCTAANAQLHTQCTVSYFLLLSRQLQSFKAHVRATSRPQLMLPGAKCLPPKGPSLRLLEVYRAPGKL